MKKVIFLTLSLTKGGAERVICNMCNEYFVEKYDVTIISLMAAKPEYELDGRIHYQAIDTAEEQYLQGLGKRFVRRRKMLVQMIKELTRNDDVAAIYSFLPEPNMLITSMTGRIKCPVIISVRNDPVKEYGGYIRQCLMRLLYPRADFFVFQTEQAREYFAFSKHIQEKSAVIPNPLNRTFLNATRKSGKKPEIVAVGRLEAQKNPFLLLLAFEKLHDEFPEMILRFFGEGSLVEKLKEEVVSRKLEQYVFLMGNTSNVVQAIEEASLYVLSSDYEGMPNALMEAMALGLPCIATDCPCGGPAFLISQEENGLLIPVGDVEELSNAMRKILSDSCFAEKLGVHAMKICEKLDPDKIYREWERVWNNDI